jgi:hypothetical protein
MPQNIRRRLFARIVLWDPNGGTIIDLPSRNVLSFGGPSESEEYVRLASGDREVVSRSHNVQIPIIGREENVVLEALTEARKSLKCIFLGPDGTDVWMWLEPTKPTITDPQVNPGDFSNKVLQLNTNVFYPAIWEGMSIFEGIPWRGTTEQIRDGNNVLRRNVGERPGYEGPLWNVPDGGSVNLVGEAGGRISDTNPATVTIDFPLPGVELQMESGGAYDSTLYALSETGTVLQYTDSLQSLDMVLPKDTRQVKLEIRSSNEPVLVTVNRVGNSQGVQEGTL